MNKRTIPYNWIFGTLFAICMVVGYSLEKFHECSFISPWTYIFILILAPVFSLLTKLAWILMQKTAVRFHKREVSAPKHNVFLSSSVMIWVLHFIVFLGVYPGFFTYDAQDELMQTVTRNFDTRHPMFHVLSMGALVQGGYKLTGDYNVGIAIFILFGMTISALGYGLFVYYLRRLGMGKAGALFLTFYFGLFPVFVMFSLCSTKDGIFSILVTLLFIFVKRMTEGPEEFFKTNTELIKLTIIAIFMMLYRNNGVYAYIVFVLVMTVCFLKSTKLKKYVKRLLISVGVAIIAYLIINSTLLAVTKASSVGAKEMITVPIMQLTRVYCYDKDSLTEEEREQILSYIPEEAIKRYNPKVSDLVKIDFNEKQFSKDRLKFFKLWAQVGIKSPQAYMNAFLMTGYGMWYPWGTIDAYKGNQVFTFTYGDSSYFGFEVEEPGYRDPKLPLINQIYRWFSLDVTIQKLPIIHLLFSPGAMLWSTLFILGFMLFNRRGMDCVAYVFPILLVMTCILGPLSLVRYALYMWAVALAAIVEINTKRCYTITTL